MAQKLLEPVKELLFSGKSFEQWRSEILPKLDRVWLGRTYGDLWDEMTPEEQAKHEEPTEAERKRVISESRLTTIFRTNMFSSYQAGRYRQLVEDAEDYPYWRYVTMEDAAVRPMHAALHGKVFRWDDPFWDTHYPPNGFNCRCEVEGLDDFDLEAQGLTLESGKVSTLTEPDGTQRAAYRDADDNVYPCDKGWSYNVGKEDGLLRAIEEKDYPEQLKLQLDEDIKKFEAEAKAAADKAKATPKKAEPETVKTVEQPAVKPASEKERPSEVKPKRSGKAKADRLQQQEQAILRDMERQNKELEAIYKQLDEVELPSEPKLISLAPESAPAAADERVIKQAEKEVKQLKAADTNSKKGAKKAKKLKKKQTSGSLPRADEAPKKVKKAKVRVEKEQAAEIELPPVKSEAATEGPLYVETPIPAKGTGAEPLREETFWEENGHLPIGKTRPIPITYDPNKETPRNAFEAAIIEVEKQVYDTSASNNTLKKRFVKKNYLFDPTPIFFPENCNIRIEQMEDYIRSKQFEYAIFIKDGKPIFGAIGTVDSVRLSKILAIYCNKHGLNLEELMKGGIIIHNHPNADSTFSCEDIMLYSHKPLVYELRVVTQNYNYYFRPNDNFRNANEEELKTQFYKMLEESKKEAREAFPNDDKKYKQKACKIAHDKYTTFFKVNDYGTYERKEI